MQEHILDHIDNSKDLKPLSFEALLQVSKELRAFIIQIVAAKEGHLGASLGVVELTVALHYVYDTPKDVLVWDVGHQAYGHKIITGRRAQFHTNRQLNGISGFPKRSESTYDAFGVGHSSTSISAVLGMALASKINKENKHHIAVIGDASIASGMAFEGLNHAGVTDSNILVILNDNAIGIDPSVGALKNYLTNVKKGTQDQDNIFEALNFKYSGPVDGHDLKALITELERLKSVSGPKLLHVITTKGKGLKLAEKHQVTYHAPGKFNAKTGELQPSFNTNSPPKFQEVFGETLLELAYRNKKIVGITPAMPTGSSMKLMMNAIPERAFDVGIAEQHAVTLAAGMAAEGLIPYCNIYSTFLQRAYDQVIHDVALQNLPVVFCLDRAGLVGQDGATHHGVFDIAYLRCIPNLIIATPRDAIRLRQMLYTAQDKLNRPMAIRYPRGRGAVRHWKLPFKKVAIGKAERLHRGDTLAILSFGTIADNVSPLFDDAAIAASCSHYAMEFVHPLDEHTLHQIFKVYKAIITIEDGVIRGGAGSAVLEFMAKYHYILPVAQMGIPHEFIDHGTVEELQHQAGLDSSSIKRKIQALLKLVGSR